MNKKCFKVILFYILFILNINSEELRILTAVEPPTNYYLEDGTFTGTTTDIILEIKNYLKLDSPIEVLSWARAYSYSKLNPNTVIYTCGRTQERIDHGFHFIGPVMTRKHILWSLNKSNYNIQSIQDIKRQNLKLVGMRDDWRTEFFINSGVTVYEVQDHEYSLKILLNERIDLWISSDLEAPEIAKKIGVNLANLKEVYIFKEAPSFIMLSKDSTKENIKNWENAFIQLQESEYFNNLALKWSKILGYELGYSKDKGLYIK